jgi:hypothetical protein
VTAPHRSHQAAAEQRLSDVLNERRFDLAFVRFGAHGEKIEMVRVL